MNADFNDIFSAVVKVNPGYSMSRRRMNVYSRMVIARYLADRGYSENGIGKMLGVDHSTVDHYKKSYDDCMRYVREFREFDTAVKMNVIAGSGKLDDEKIEELSRFTTCELLMEIDRRESGKK